MDFAFLKQRYDYELERRDRLTDAVSQPAGFLALLGGVITVMARGFSYDEAWLTIVFLVPLLMAVAAAAFSTWHLAAAYCHQEYIHLPDLAELVKAQGEVLERRLLRAMTEAEAIEEFMVMLRKRVIETSDRNSAVNRFRTRELRRANRAVLFVLVATSVVGVTYIVDQARSSFMPKQRIVLTDPAEVPERPVKFPENVIDDESKPYPHLPKGVRLNLPWGFRWWYGDPPNEKDDEPGEST